MAVPPRQPPDQSVRKATRLGVYIAREPGRMPTAEEEEPYVYCTEIYRGANGRLPTATFEVDLGRLNQRIREERLIKDMCLWVEVWTLKKELKDSDESTRDELLFQGEIDAADLSIESGNEKKTLTARIAQHHFVLPVQGIRYWRDGNSISSLYDYPLEFNPLVDGKVFDNMILPANPEDGIEGILAARNDEEYAIFVDPDSISPTALKHHHGKPQRWTLREAVRFLCYEHNREIGFSTMKPVIRNPDEGDLAEVLKDADYPKIRNVTIPLGTWLPQALDHLLNPSGFGWFLSPTVTEGDVEGQQQIVIYRRGRGPERTLLLQKIADRLDVTKSNISRLNVKYDVGTVVNAIKVLGSFAEREITVELYRAWPDNLDDSISDETPSDSDAGRLWLANEGGDITFVRYHGPDSPPKIAYNLDNSDMGVIKRRPLSDCLTYRTRTRSEEEQEEDESEEGGSEAEPETKQKLERQPVSLEISTDDGETWSDARFLAEDGEENQDWHGWRLLSDQIGIRITGKIPELLQETDPSRLRMRITGTIKLDYRISYVTEDDPESANTNRVVQYIDASDRFHDRRRTTADEHNVGEFASVLTGDLDERDDTEAIEEYARELLKTQRMTQITASFPIPGIDTSWEVGDVITKVEGREISFNRLAESDPEKSYIQVIGIRYQNTPGAQWTILETESFDT